MSDMVNITQFSEKSKQIQNLFQIFFDLTGPASYWKIDQETKKPFIDNSSGNYEESIQKPNQKFFIHNQDGIKKDHEKTINKLKFLKCAMEKNKVTQDVLKKALTCVYMSIPIMQVNYSKGEARRFEARAKGTARYNKKISGDTMDYIKNHCTDAWESVFLTLTCDIKQYRNIYDAWKNYNQKEVKPVMENFRKHYGCEYVGIMESTAKGYPHIHLVCFFPKGTIKGYDKMQNKQKIRNGKLFEKIKSTVSSPVFCLECAKGEGLKYYLTKYVTKGSTQSLFSLRNKEEKFTKAELKEIYGFLFTKVTKTRTLLKCKDRSEIALKAVAERKRQEENERKLRTRIEVKEKSRRERAKRNAHSLRRYLISTCTNSPFHNPKSVYSQSAMQYENYYKSLPERFKSYSPQETLAFECFGQMVSDKSGFFVDFCDFVCGNFQNRINRKTYFDIHTGIYSQFSDGYDLDDDKDFIECVSAMLKYYFEEMFIKGFSYLEVVEEYNFDGVQWRGPTKDYILERMSSHADLFVSNNFKADKFAWVYDVIRVPDFFNEKDLNEETLEEDSFINHEPEIDLEGENLMKSY